MKKTLFLLLLSLSLVIGQQSKKCGPNMDEVPTGAKTSCIPRISPTPLADGQLLRWNAATGQWEFVTLVDREIPSGTIDGTNADFVLANVPNPPAALIVKRNGLEQMPSVDYTLSSGTITFASASIPQPGDVISVSYRY